MLKRRDDPLVGTLRRAIVSRWLLGLSQDAFCGGVRVREVGCQCALLCLLLQHFGLLLVAADFLLQVILEVLVLRCRVVVDR